MCLEKVEEVTPGVVAATASLKVLVSMSTLCFIFPQLLQASRVGIKCPCHALKAAKHAK
ncbi:hypothetical protein V7S43_017442 [Phytophthora oleae]|uniref:Uncharacterized protein n=1 Tax=Phytophthora oleae TaxID=2107226 RepID=A0ABD3EWZ5_9STRA